MENLYARYGTKSPLLVFAGHTDVRCRPATRAPGAIRPSRARPKAALLYGRGAVDMKGAIAAMLSAVLGFIRSHPDFNGSIAFLITGDEEGPAINGSVKLLEWAHKRGERFDHLPARRADQPAESRRHAQDRAARLAHRCNHR